MWENFNPEVRFGTTTFLLSLLELSKASLLSRNEEKKMYERCFGDCTRVGKRYAAHLIKLSKHQDKKFTC